MTTTKNSFPLTFFVLALGFIVARIIGHFIISTYDDAFITYRYARNLAEGYGMVYQPGEWVMGVTCPGFALVAALIHRIGLPIVSSVLALSIAADVLTLALTWKILSRERGQLAALMFALCFTVSPMLMRIGVGGMEMCLFVLLSLVAIALYERGNKVGATALAAGCYFLRPEGVLLLLVLFGLEFWERKKLGDAARLVGVAIGVMLIPFLLIHHYYGFLLPQSVRAKSHDMNSPLMAVAHQLLVPDSFSRVMLPFALWGVIIFVRQRGLQTNSFLRTVLLWGSLYLAAYLAARPFMWSWYGAPICYVQFLFAALGLADILRRFSFTRKEGWKRVVPLAGALPICFWLLILMRVGPSEPQRFVYEPMQKWTQEHDLTHSSVMADDIGAIGFYSGAYIYDNAGLVWPGALRYKTLQQSVDVNTPDYILANAIRDKIVQMQTPQMKSEYTPIVRFSPTRDTDMRVDSRFYPDEWMQDYILFKRNKPVHRDLKPR